MQLFQRLPKFRWLSLISVLAWLLAVWPANAETTQHDAHLHGEGAMNIVLDGKLLEVEFISPAENILGFEHEAKTEAEKTAIAQAREILSMPIDLLGLPDAAQCSVIETEVNLEFTDQASGHGEFHSLYRMECSHPDKLVKWDVKVFDLFPGTQAIEVQLVTPKGQTRIELNNEKPGLNLSEFLQ